MVMNENVRVFRTVDDIGKECIDSISIDGFFTYGYFKALETSNAHNVELFYIVVYENDKIVGVAPCFFDSLDILSVSKAIKKMLSLGSRLGLLQKRVLICYSQPNTDQRAQKERF